VTVHAIDKARLEPWARAGMAAGMTGTPNDPGAVVHHASQSGGEQLLLDAMERALRAPRGKLALALHLSRLKPPSPLPHHARISRALLQDTAQRYGGQVFPLRNGDLVLLCTAPTDDQRLVSAQWSPISLPTSLARLFGADAPEQDRLTTTWRLDEDAERFRAFVQQRPDGPVVEMGPDEGLGSIAGLLPLEPLIGSAQVPDLLAQQTAIQLLPGANLPISARLAPLFRELTFSLAGLTQTREAAETLGDPYLFRYFATRLDARMLAHLHDDLEHGGKLTRGALRQNLPLHLNLTLEGIVSPDFARLVESARRVGARFGIEVSLMEATADDGMMAYARRLLDMAGFPLIVDGLDYVGLTMTHPAGLSPAFVKLAWSPRLAEAAAPARAAMEAAIKRIGVERLVLQHAESEAALVWGQAHGISRYQGFFLDAVQSAARISGCHSARACTLRQCITRAASLNPGVRAGCGNPALLDMAPDYRPAQKGAATQAAATPRVPSQDADNAHHRPR
jgi:hypothetical protein